jgi:formylglycine-generating enzyme required for sulfatase activity
MRNLTSKVMKTPLPRRLNRLKPAFFGVALWLLVIMPWPPSTAQNSQSKRQLEKISVHPEKNSQRRIALVIGNGAYQNASRLSNPPNDAEDIATALRQLGFELVGNSAHVNQNADQMKHLIVDFGEMLNGGGVGLFYYAGHGVQSQGHNYLIPVEANILRERTLEFDAVDVNRVLAQMDAAGNGFNIVILDACRNNPFTRSWRDASQGLAQVNAPEGTLIAYSTSPGRVADDGKGRNGTYTAELLRQMSLPGVVIEEMFKSVRVGVRTATKNQQTPWESSSLVGTFCLAGCGLKNAANDSKSSLSAGDADGEFWLTIRNSSDPEDFRAYLKGFPSGRFVANAQNNLRRLEAANSARTNSGTSKPEDAKSAPGKPSATLRNKYGIEMVWIPSGSFPMGSENGNIDEQPVHRISLSNGFYMGRYEVTQAQWKAVMGITMDQQRDQVNASWPLRGEGDAYPVYYVSWQDAQEFIGRLNQMNDGYAYRLPTEAEWEYACRAGTSGDYAGDLDSTAWYGNNSGRRYLDAAEMLRNDRNNYMQRLGDNGNQAHAVGTKQANAFGLSDMQGNVWEWCEDWYDENYYKNSPSSDPRGPTGGTYRVMRGGAWSLDAPNCRTALRHWVTPTRRMDISGFRVVAIERTSNDSYRLEARNKISPRTADSIGLTLALQQCKLANTAVVCDMTITSNDTDRKLDLFTYQLSNPSRLFDDSGNEFLVAQVRLANRVGEHVLATLIAGVPVKASLRFEGISAQANRISLLRIRGTLLFSTDVRDLTVEFRDVLLDK